MKTNALKQMVCLLLIAGSFYSCAQRNNYENITKILEIKDALSILYIIESVEGHTPQNAYQPNTKEVIMYIKTTDTKATYGYVDSEGKEHTTIVDNFPDFALNWKNADDAFISSGTIVYKINIIISGEIYTIENSYHLKLESIKQLSEIVDVSCWNIPYILNNN